MPSHSAMFDRISLAATSSRLVGSLRPPGGGRGGDGGRDDLKRRRSEKALGGSSTHSGRSFQAFQSPSLAAGGTGGGALAAGATHRSPSSWALNCTSPAISPSSWRLSAP